MGTGKLHKSRDRTQKAGVYHCGGQPIPLWEFGEGLVYVETTVPITPETYLSGRRVECSKWSHSVHSVDWTKAAIDDLIEPFCFGMLGST